MAKESEVDTENAVAVMAKESEVDTEKGVDKDTVVKA